jgi:Holliday junction resolvasome RuvABC endonuclease subunit
MGSPPAIAVLAIDPGATSGWAVVTVELQPRVLRCGQLALAGERTPTNVVTSVLGDPTCSVTYAVIEDQYVAVNKDSAIKLARSAGRWEEACRWHGLRVDYVAAATWQAAELALRGRAKRAQLAAALRAKAGALYGDALREHEASAALIGRWWAVQRAWRGAGARRRTA